MVKTLTYCENIDIWWIKYCPMAKPLAYDQNSVELTDNIGLCWNVDLCHKYWYIWPYDQNMVKHWSMVKILTYTNIGQLWKSWPMVKNLTYVKSMSICQVVQNGRKLIFLMGDILTYDEYLDTWWNIDLLSFDQKNNGQILTHGENLDIWWKHLNLWLKYWHVVKILTNGENSVQLSKNGQTYDENIEIWLNIDVWWNIEIWSKTVKHWPILKILKCAEDIGL